MSALSQRRKHRDINTARQVHVYVAREQQLRLILPQCQTQGQTLSQLTCCLNLHTQTHTDHAVAECRMRCRATLHFRGRGLFWEKESYTFLLSQPHISTLPLHILSDRTLHFTYLFSPALSLPSLYHQVSW